MTIQHEEIGEIGSILSYLLVNDCKGLEGGGSLLLGLINLRKESSHCTEVLASC